MADTANLQAGESPEIVPTTRIEQYLTAAINGTGTEGLPAPISNVDYLLLQLIQTLQGGGAGGSGGLKCVQYKSTGGLSYDSESKVFSISIDATIPENWSVIMVTFYYEDVVVSRNEPLTLIFHDFDVPSIGHLCGTYYEFSLNSIPTEAIGNLELLFLNGGDLGQTQSRIFVDYSLVKNKPYIVTVFYEE